MGDIGQASPASPTSPRPRVPASPFLRVPPSPLRLSPAYRLLPTVRVRLPAGHAGPAEDETLPRHDFLPRRALIASAR
jgi:hypothetical protein